MVLAAKHWFNSYMQLTYNSCLLFKQVYKLMPKHAASCHVVSCAITLLAFVLLLIIQSSYTKQKVAVLFEVYLSELLV